MNNNGMDKLGVDTPEQDKNGQKLAASSDTCPICGRRVERNGRVVRCPVHGSEPFEG